MRVCDQCLVDVVNGGGIAAESIALDLVEARYALRMTVVLLIVLLSEECS